MAYVTASLVRAYLDGTSTADDALISSLIDRAQSLIESYVGFSFLVESDTTRYLDADADTDGLTLIFDQWCASITTVTNGDGTEITSDYYVTLPRNDGPYYGIKLLSSSGYTWELDSNSDSENAISVEGRWGWSTTVPNDIVHVTIRLVSWMYHQRKNQQETDRTIITDGAVITPANMPRDIIAVLDQYKRRV